MGRHPLGWSRGDLGTYLINDFQMVGRRCYKRFSSILLDGQQRLTTIERYITDQLAVPDVSGKLRLWSEVSVPERRRFSSLVFSRATCKVWDEHQLRVIYDQRNFGGTPHTEAERALPIEDEEEHSRPVP